METRNCNDYDHYTEKDDLEKTQLVEEMDEDEQTKLVSREKSSSRFFAGGEVKVAGGMDSSDRASDLAPYVSSLQTHRASDLAPYVSSLQTHIACLYILVTCLTISFSIAVTVCYMEITALRATVSVRQDTKSDDALRPVVADHDSTLPYFDAEGLTLATLSSATIKRRKRQTEYEDSAAQDWLLMNTLVRNTRSKEGMISAIKGYCREAQLYCAAEGPRGPPGDKGEPGIKGEKGDNPDTAVLAMNLANLESIRGPPGPKGDKGSDGMPGPIGPKGDQGPPGRDGITGPRGAKGEPGMRGLLGFPGLEGSPGQPGIQGPKGEPGDTGKDGPPGIHGNKGERGATGPKGDRGQGGLPGVPGYKGYTGDVGPPGPQGPIGPRGEPGFCPVHCLEPEHAIKSQPRNDATLMIPCIMLILQLFLTYFTA